MVDAEKIRSLIKLLDDPDENVFNHIKDEICSFGPDVIPYLENAWETDHLGILFQQRIENLIHDIQLDSLKSELKKWKTQGGQDLMEGMILIAKYQYPDLDPKSVYETLEAIKKDIWVELHEDLTALEKIKVINHILYDVYEFKANKKDYHAPQNSYINNALEYKKSNPIGLSVIYCYLAQQLGIPILGVNLPRHFVLCYLDLYGKDPNTPIEREDILFYINPFANGSIFNDMEIEQFIKQLDISQHDAFYLPCDNESIILRTLNNLQYSYEKLGYTDKVNDIVYLREVFSGSA